MRIVIAALSLLWAGGAAAETVTAKLFDATPMRSIGEPTKLHYRYEMSGSSIGRPFTSSIDVDVREVAADGSKKVWMDLFEGENARHFGPVEAKGQNPLVLVFLQRDVHQMGTLTGGAAGYFQQQLRRSFNAEADTAPVQVSADGQDRTATRLTIRPFEADPKIDRFPKFRQKSYEFTVADWVPGGIWQLSAITPDVATGEVILRETVTFDRVAP